MAVPSVVTSAAATSGTQAATSRVSAVPRARTVTRVAGGAAIAIGIGLFLVPFVTSLFTRTTAADHLTSAVRPAMTRSAIAAGADDLHSVVTAYGQLGNGLLPAMAAQMHESPATLVSQLRTQYPEIGAGMDNFNTGVANANRILTLLSTNRARYVAADSLPAPGLPLSAAPWAYLAVGTILVGLGVGCFFWPTAALSALVVVGVGIAVVPLALSVPSKMADTRALVHNLSDTLSPQGAATARGQFTTFNTMLTTFDTKALPAFASQNHMNNAQLNAFVAAHAPLLASGAPDVPRILTKFGGLTKALVVQVRNYDRMSKLPFRRLALLLVIPGFVLTVLAGAALVDRRRERIAAT